MRTVVVCICLVLTAAAPLSAQDWWKPYSDPCTERENVFAFTEKPAVKLVEKDRFEITFAVEGFCDATVGIVDPSVGAGKAGEVVRHLGAGVLGKNAPEPFQKNSLKQKIYWNGKDDLGYYVKQPEKLRVRVMLGFKPVFHRNLGGTSMYDMPCLVNGIAVDKDGVYVFSVAHRSRSFIRAFGHDGKYLHSVIPPPANLPVEKWEGRGYIEYEPGKKAVHSPDLHSTVWEGGQWLPVKGNVPKTMRPAAGGGRIYYLNTATLTPSGLYYVNTDGSTDHAGCNNRPALPDKYRTGDKPHLAVSPDGKWIYMANDTSGRGKGKPNHTIWRCAADTQDPAKPFVGTPGKPGKDNESLNGPVDVDCDGTGRVYVCDKNNGRVQVFSPDGKYLKTIEILNPLWVGVHRKDGDIYVMHDAQVKGKSVSRITKYSAYPETKKLFHHDGIVCSTAALDSWSATPRIWVAGGMKSGEDGSSKSHDYYQVHVYEEQGKSFRKVLDFDEEAKKHAGADYLGRWDGSIRNRVFCDPSRDEVYLQFNKAMGAFRFDIATGKLIEYVNYPAKTDDLAFDKKGYMHVHLNPGNALKGGVVRLDPGQHASSRASDIKSLKHIKEVRYKEVPYDYGVLGHDKSIMGMIPVKDQGGSKHFQDGMGVNMRGDVAEECNIYYVPKGSDIGDFATLGSAESRGSSDWYLARNKGTGMESGTMTYARFLTFVEGMEKKGTSVYYIKRRPGLPLAGGTVWTFDATGELRDECAVIAGNLINGVHIDEDGELYFTVNRQRIHDRKVFLHHRMGIVGGEGGKSPFLGTFIKSRKNNVRVLSERSSLAPVSLDEKPTRPVEVGGYVSSQKDARAKGFPGEYAWVEGAEWFYAGSSPIVVCQPCSCNTMRCGLDWYKRSYVIEQYRHSFGVVDTNGNLIVHMGRYGNRDSGDGAKSRIPVGGDNIVTSFTEYISATDNYVCFDDNGERLVAVKITYHAEETAPITTN